MMQGPPGPAKGLVRLSIGAEVRCECEAMLAVG